jgi:hypothetical protein
VNVVVCPFLKPWSLSRTALGLNRPDNITQLEACMFPGPIEEVTSIAPQEILKNKKVVEGGVKF